VSQLAIYRQEETPSNRSHRLFPIYSYQHDLTEDVTQTRILLVYKHEQSPIHAADRLLPLWQYERWNDQSETRLNALGFGSLSLYEHHTKPTGTTDRFFPLYEYVSNHDRDETEFSLLWPLANSRAGRVRSRLQACCGGWRPTSIPMPTIPAFTCSAGLKWPWFATRDRRRSQSLSSTRSFRYTGTDTQQMGTRHGTFLEGSWGWTQHRKEPE